MKILIFLPLLFLSYRGTAQKSNEMKTQNENSLAFSVAQTNPDARHEKANLIATMEILPGFETEVKKAIATLAAETQKEADCELFLVSTKNDSPQTIVVYEVYKNGDAFEHHKLTAHAQAFFEWVKGKIKNDQIDIEFMTLMGN